MKSDPSVYFSNAVFLQATYSAASFRRPVVCSLNNSIHAMHHPEFLMRENRLRFRKDLLATQHDNRLYRYHLLKHPME